MALYQQSVLNKYLSGLAMEEVQAAYTIYQTHFNDPDKLENIQAAKEEQYQEGFLRDLFVEVLGYTINPNPNYNLITELKNTGKSSKKADGAILRKGKAIGVIELKSTKTKTLEKIKDQAFGYKHHHPQCNYVITSNFEKLRLYIQDATDFEEFDLFKMTIDRFKILYISLQQANVLEDLPLQIKQASKVQEEDITKQLYKDYKVFKDALYQSICELNPQFDQLLLFKKTQKLLDRLLFIFFAEDKGLLPPNSIVKIVDQWEKLKELDEIQPLYSRIQKYFGYMNSGFKGKQYTVHAYNGGLFAPDELLDQIAIDDEVLRFHSLKLAAYDFNSEVDVNILGHIFEHSLSDIEEEEAKLLGQAVDKKKSKRKKDGVFYTPKYITQYIVENTVGQLCNTYKTEHKIEEDDYTNSKRKTKKKKKELLDKLETYRDYLLGLTICDPACGSGAFLNQTLNFLIAEHHWIDELKSKLLGGGFVFPHIENSILEKNIYGVDINEESVEIAKLSLWLRTAQVGRTLTTLSNNIKCGNSLIDDPEVAGDKAFNWEKEFPEVFKNGGFDVVVGNPPYLRVQGLRENFKVESQFYENQFESATGRFDIYVLFIEKSYSLINKKGKVSFILPHKFLTSDFGIGIRNFLLKHEAVDSILHFGAEMVFTDAATYTCIIKLTHRNDHIKFKVIDPKMISTSFSFDKMKYTNLSSDKWILKSEVVEQIFTKLNSQKFKVKDVFEYISQGIVSVGDDIFILQGEIKGSQFTGYSKGGQKIELEANILKPLLKGENVKKYAPLQNQYYCLYPHKEFQGKTIPYDEEYFQANFPLAYNYILPFKDKLIEKKIRYKTNPKYWYSLHRSREISLFEQEKLVTPETSLGTNLTYDNNFYYHNTQVYSLIRKKDSKFQLKVLLAILNNPLFWFFLKLTGAVLRGGYFRFKTKYLEPFPVPDVPNDELQNKIINKVDKSLEWNVDFHKKVNTFRRLLNRKFSIEKLSKKLQNWYQLSFAEFVKELKKKKVKLSLSEEMEWEEFFEIEKKKVLAIQTQITQTDQAIDQMVYQLYGLTPEEIAIVAQSI